MPIVEPEVLMDADNDIETCYRATKRTLHKVFDELYHQRVDLGGILLKPNMVISGKGSADAGERRRGRRLDAQVLPRGRPGGGARDRLPLGRPVRRAGEREPERDQLAWAAAVGALVLVRPRAPGARAGGVGRIGRERRGGAVVPRPPCAQQQRRGRRPLLGAMEELARST